MIIHPDLTWLQEIEENIHNKAWRLDNLERIMESLIHYLTHEYVLSASSILSICFDDMLGQGQYRKLKELHQIAVRLFDSNLPFPHPEQTNHELNFDNSNNIGVQNTDEFLNEYFILRLNLAHVTLMLHDIDQATEHLECVRSLLHKTTLVNQIEAYCIFLKFQSYGHEIELDFDLVRTAQQLAYQFSPKLQLKTQMSIAYHYYSKGNIHEMEKTLQKIHRLIVKVMPDQSEISEITAQHNFYLAVMYRELHQYNKAFTKLDIAADQYSRLNHHLQNVLVLYEKSMFFCFTDKLIEALQWIELAIEDFEKLPEKQDYHRAMLEHGKGIILYRMGQYDEALTLFQRVALIWEKYQHPYHIALATNAKGATLRELNRPDEAIELFEKAKVMCSEMLDKEHVVVLYRQINENIDNLKDVV